MQTPLLFVPSGQFPAPHGHVEVSPTWHSPGIQAETLLLDEITSQNKLAKTVIVIKNLIFTDNVIKFRIAKNEPYIRAFW